MHTIRYNMRPAVNQLQLNSDKTNGYLFNSILRNKLITGRFIYSRAQWMPRCETGSHLQRVRCSDNGHFLALQYKQINVAYR